MTGLPRETVYLVPHTHWDREWYEPFQRFRLRLVNLLDDVLTRAEADPLFHFTLDGQTAAVDDHLDVRPQDASRVAALVASGQLAVGPWEILLDEFLCSGETIVRNLQRGWARAQQLGTAMPVGYLPDMFGHCAQMPQILALAGISHACLWRGVPSTVDKHGFRWEAPDGTAVRCEYLLGGYGNAAYLLSDESLLERRAAEFVTRKRPWYGDDPVLAMYGTDHSAPLPSLLPRVRALEHADAGVRLQVCTLADYLALLDPDDPGLLTWRGELRSHARANLLPGVLSARMHLKQAMGSAERMVERYAEPWAALWSAPDRWPGQYLDMAWQRLVASSCHDSVTGCGVDDTAVQVAARIAEAEQLGQAVRDGVVADLARQVPADAVLVLNPSPERRSGLVQVTVPSASEELAFELPDGSRIATQEVARHERLLFSGGFPATGLRETIIRRSFGQELFNRRIQWWEHQGTTVTFHVGRIGDDTFDIDTAADAIDALARGTGGDWTLRILAEPLRTVLADVPVPPLGWVSMRPCPGTAEPAGAPVTVTESTVDNGQVAVLVRPDGTMRVTGRDGTVLDGVGRIVDGGDAGDTYNYAPPTTDTIVDQPSSVDVEVAERGPLLGALVIRRSYSWPGGLTADRSARAAVDQPTVVTTRVELRIGESFARLTVDFDNRCRDHRVRMHVPLAKTATSSYAEGQFAAVERGLTSEGGYGEVPLPTFPAGAFVDAGGAAVLLRHSTEYELVDGGSELALTLLRATGQLSRSVHAYREEPAGPELATPLAQCLGVSSTSIAVLPHDWPWQVDHVLRAAERFRHDLHAVNGLGLSGEALADARGLELAGGAVMTSLRRREDWLELRLAALTPEPTWAKVFGVSAARRADLLGRPGDPLPLVNGQLRLSLRAWEIATIQIHVHASWV